MRLSWWRRGKFEVGEWKIENGGWRMEDREWRK
jgi:hypothetical protein